MRELRRYLCEHWNVDVLDAYVFSVKHASFASNVTERDTLAYDRLLLSKQRIEYKAATEAHTKVCM